MSFDFLDYHKLVMFGLGKKSSIPPELHESLYRNIVSRVYYALLITTREYLESIGDLQELKRDEKGHPIEGSHQRILRSLRESNKLDSFTQLKRLKKLRESADYDVVTKYEIEPIVISIDKRVKDYFKSLY